MQLLNYNRSCSLRVSLTIYNLEKGVVCKSGEFTASFLPGVFPLTIHCMWPVRALHATVHCESSVLCSLTVFCLVRLRLEQKDCLNRHEN